MGLETKDPLLGESKIVNRQSCCLRQETSIIISSNKDMYREHTGEEVHSAEPIRLPVSGVGTQTMKEIHYAHNLDFSFQISLRGVGGLKV